jgi:hypothetical protein
MSTRLAYLAEGRLFYRDNGTSKPIESTFGQDVINRALQRAQKHDWKTGGENQGGGMYNRQSLWGVRSEDPRAIKVRITAVASGKTENELLYVVSTESVGGLFSYDLQNAKETRIFHKENLYLSDFSKQTDGDLIACTQRMGNGTASITIINGQDVNDVTEGDSVDEAPAWIPGQGKTLVYQCSGIARSKQGYMMGTGHAHIQKLNLQTGDLTTVLENEKYDFLSPRMNTDGDLFYIRRPYDSAAALGNTVLSPGKAILDVLLFPFRLCRAFFDFLNVFSMVFSKKPLTTAGGPKVEGPDEKMLFLRGKLIDAEKAMQEKGEGELDEPPALVPRSWQLVCRKADGTEKVIASSVLSYDLAADKILYSNGCAVFQVEQSGSNRTLLFKDKLVDTLVLLS